MKKWTPKTTLIVAGVAVIGLWYLKGRAARAISEAGQAINPTNNQNVFYRGVNGVGEAVTGDDDFSLGGWIYDKVHGQ